MFLSVFPTNSASIGDDPEMIFIMYKEREGVEQAFDAMKKELENDRSYLRDDESVVGYFFIWFISLCIYYSIFVLIRTADLTGQYSAKGVLLRYSKVYLTSRDRKECTSEVTASVQNIDLKLGINIFPKI